MSEPGRLGAALGGLLITSASLCSAGEPAAKPNIVLILADDMGYSDIGCYGSEIATPNLDRLARQGLRFTQFYNAARCCPSRASLLTGLYPHQAGVGHMVNDLGYPAYQGYLNDRCVTLGEVMQTEGYQTLMSGKWHVGNRPGSLPRDRGFDRYFGLIDGASSYFERIPYRINQEAPRMMIDEAGYEPPGEGFYMTDAITDYAIRFLGERPPSHQPFFLYLAYTAPHWPLHALPDDIAKYRGKYLRGWDILRKERFDRQKRLGLVPSSLRLSPRDPQVPAWDSLPREEQQMWDLRMAVYAAMVDRLDQNIGRVLDYLEKTGALENTLVVFLADNGGCHERIRNRGTYIRTMGETGNRDSFDSYEFPWANLSNTPFRMHKHWVHEGGISTPCIMVLPGYSDAGKIVREPCHLVDIMPTLLDFCGGTYPGTFRGKSVLPAEGISLKPLLNGKRSSRPNPLFWEHQGNRAMRDGNWKLVSTYDSGTNAFTEWELYHLRRDRTELNDLGSRKPEKKAGMIREFEEWARQAGVIDRGLLERK